MGMPRDTSPYGSQTLQGPAWPNVDEDQLLAAAASYTKIATKISGTVVPEQTNQLSKLTGSWEGGAALAATGEATTMISGHEMNALQAQAIATALETMSMAVVQTKTMLNTAAEEVQAEVTALQQLAAIYPNVQQLIESRIKMGLSQNIATVSAASSEMAGSLSTIANLPQTSTPPTAQATQAAEGGADQMLQMVSQLPSMLSQIPQMASQIPQQLTQPLQQLSQPLQQLTSMLGSGSGGTGSGVSPFSAFSNHPAAGGSGPSSGAGLMKAAGLPGGLGGGSPQTPLMSNLVGSTAPVSVNPGAGGGVMAGIAPVAAANAMGGGMGGGMGPMMGQRGSAGAGGTTTGLSAPAPLEHDLGEGDDDYDDW